MRTYNLKFNESNTGFKAHFRTDKEDFRRMRQFILRAYNGCEHTFISRLVDIIDDIKEMGIGETMYVISSAYEPYNEKTFAEFERTVAMMERAARESIGEKYMPNENTAFMVRRTNQMWKFAGLDYDIE